MATNQENMQNGENGNGMASAQIGNRMIGSMQGGMNGMGSDGDKRRAKREYRAKMRRYKAKHDQAKAVFEHITGKAPETRKEAEDIYELILKRGSAAEKSKATFAVADFCWACDEKEAEKEVREDVDGWDEEDE